jgi:hypothetical protein
MAWLVACEESQKVCQAFRKRGIEAYSCDLVPTRGNPDWHIQGDAIEAAYSRQWTGMVAHPVCRYLTNTGVCWLHKDPSRWQKMRQGAEFFKALLDAPIKYKAIENPIMHKYAVEIVGRRQDQVIQPWMFGHPEKKATCLWLVNLPKLKPTNDVSEYMKTLPKNVQQRIHYMAPGPNRERDRSETFQGIADAIADQYGVFT